MMMTQMSTAQVSAADERAVVAVLTRYPTGIDTRDWALFRSCFTADLEADYGNFGFFRGARAISDFMRDGHAALGPTLHRLSNIVLSRDDADIVARSYVDALLMPGAGGGAAHRGVGWYDDRLVRTADGWKISRRRFHAVLLE